MNLLNKHKVTVHKGSSSFTFNKSLAFCSKYHSGIYNIVILSLYYKIMYLNNIYPYYIRMTERTSFKPGSKSLAKWNCTVAQFHAGKAFSDCCHYEILNCLVRPGRWLTCRSLQTPCSVSVGWRAHQHYLAHGDPLKKKSQLLDLFPDCSSAKVGLYFKVKLYALFLQTSAAFCHFKKHMW